MKITLTSPSGETLAEWDAPELLERLRALSSRLPWCTCPVEDCRHEREGGWLRELLARIDGELTDEERRTR